TALGQVADSSRGSTLGRGRLESVRRTIVADTVATLRYVAHSRRGAALRRALAIRRAGGSRPGTALGQVAGSSRGSTLGRGRLERVRRTIVADTVAALRYVAHSRRRATLRRALAIHRAGGSRPGTALGQVAGSCRSSTLGRSRLERVRRTIVADTVAALRYVAHPRRRPALRRALAIPRQGGSRPGTALGQVADSSRGSTLGRSRL